MKSKIEKPVMFIVLRNGYVLKVVKTLEQARKLTCYIDGYDYRTLYVYKDNIDLKGKG